MRVLMVELGAGPEPGGAVHRTLRIAGALCAAGVPVRLLLLRAGMDERRLQDYGIPAGQVDWIPCLGRRFHLAWPSWRLIARRVAESDVVCLHAYLWGAAPWAWLAARRAGKPCVVSPHGVFPYFGRSLPLKRLAHAVFGRRLLADARTLVAITTLEGDAIRGQLGPGRHIAVVPNGVEIALPDRDTSGDGASPSPFALYLGRLDPVKGVDLLIEALALLETRGVRGPRLLIAGAGEQQAALQASVERYGLAQRVAFVGHVGAVEKHALLRGAAFVVLPSRRDAMTLVALEAGLAARPLLLSRACGFDDAFDCGGAVPIDPDVASIAEGWQRMLELQPRWEAMGRALRKRVETRYTWPAVAGRFHAVLEQAVSP